jgi:hypothetical protein
MRAAIKPERVSQIRSASAEDIAGEDVRPLLLLLLLLLLLTLAVIST